MNGKTYKVWGFRKFRGCYDCGSLDKLEACPSAPGIELTFEEFKAFEHAIRWSSSASDYVYLYHDPHDTNEKVATTVRELVRIGFDVIAEEEAKKAKQAAKAKERVEKARLSEEQKALKLEEEERKLLKKLEAKYKK